MTRDKIGFIGLGNMGGAIAARIAAAGFDMVVYDIAGTVERAPQGSVPGESVADVARQSSVIILSLPTLAACAEVVEEIALGDCGDDVVVVNTSTVGPTVALAAHERLAADGIAYVDAPVSGSVFRAREGGLSVMYSGTATLLERLRPVFDTFAANVFNIGTGIGQGQRMKLVNNYLVVSAFVTTSEALAFGEKGGLDMKTMLDVVNVSTGQNFVSEHMFPRYVLSGTFESGGSTAIIKKDLSLFVEAAAADGRKHEVAKAALEVIEVFDEARPGVDQMLIYPFVRDHD